MATRIPVDAVSWMTPCQSSGSPVSSRSQLDDDLLDLGQRGRRLPRDAERAEPGRGDVPEHGRQARVRREPAEEVRALRLGDPRDDDAVEVAQHLLERLRRLRRVRGEAGRHLAGLDLRRHRQVRDAPAVIGDPVDERWRGGAELLGRHGLTVRTTSSVHGRPARGGGISSTAQRSASTGRERPRPRRIGPGFEQVPRTSPRVCLAAWLTTVRPPGPSCSTRTATVRPASEPDGGQAAAYGAGPAVDHQPARARQQRAVRPRATPATARRADRARARQLIDSR